MSAPHYSHSLPTKLADATFHQLPRFWQSCTDVSLKQDFPNVKALAFDFDHTIANMEQLHHETFREAAIELIRGVLSSSHPAISPKNAQFKEFWLKAKRGFGLQEMDTVATFTEAIRTTYPEAFKALLVREALRQTPSMAIKIETVLREGGRIDSELYLELRDGISQSLKHKRDQLVLKRFETDDIVIREIDGAVDLLHRAKTAGYKLGIVTGSPSNFVVPILKAMKIYDLFDAAVYNDDEVLRDSQHKKPHPFPYLEIVRRLDPDHQMELRPENVMVFEDSVTGFRAAHAAGMPVVVRPPTNINSIFKSLLDFGEVQPSSVSAFNSQERALTEKRRTLIKELETSDAPIMFLLPPFNPELKGVSPYKQRITWEAVKI